VDLSSVTYIDSSGVASLVEALQAAKRNGGRFALVAASDPTRRVLELARLDKVFTIYTTVDEGLQA
jgi:anti-sigma B factor antagonist